MACERKNTAWRIKNKLNKNGKAIYVFKKPELGANNYEEVHLPCRKCTSCQLSYAKEWAIRCWHEASGHEHNSFLTLTFNEENLNTRIRKKRLKNVDGSILHKEDYQLFMKRLRKFNDIYEYDYQQNKYVKRPIPISKMLEDVRPSDKSIRYFHCGEYGDQSQRPHHHACLFNYDFQDKYQFSSSNGNPLYNSRTLDWLWSEHNTNYEKAMSIEDDADFKQYIKFRGYAVIGEVTLESASYTARYIVKKHNRTKRVKDQIEYTTMSRRPAIGKDWIHKYYSDIYPYDNITLTDNKKAKIPRYYDKEFAKIDDIEYNLVKEKRIIIAKQTKGTLEQWYYNQESHRKISNQKIKKFVRNYENQGA